MVGEKMDRMWLLKRLEEKDYPFPIQVNFEMARKVMEKKDYLRLKKLVGEYNASRNIESDEDLHFFALHLEVLTDESIIARYNMVRVRFKWAGIIGLLAAFVILFNLAAYGLFPVLIPFTRPIVSALIALIIVYMVVTKETTKKQSWVNLPISTKVIWWSMLLLNMLNLANLVYLMLLS
jgi:hypothetical protein